MKTKIVTFGEIMIRLSKPGYQRLFQGRNFEGNYGGSEANVAVSLAFMGDNVEYVTRVPYGPLGDAALMHLREYNLNVYHVVKEATVLVPIISRKLWPCATPVLCTTARTLLSIPSSAE